MGTTHQYFLIQILALWTKSTDVPPPRNAPRFNSTLLVAFDCASLALEQYFSKRETPVTIDLHITSHSTADPVELAQFAADMCYNGETPMLAGSKHINVRSRLFEVSHHTTLAHWSATFAISGLSVNGFTMGLHLAAPFYNSDQRSGRFCSAMFDNPDFVAIEAYIRDLWPTATSEQVAASMHFVRRGATIYGDNIAKATAAIAERIPLERPRANQKYIDANAPKFAQEQLRMFMPSIYPTAAAYTLSLVGIFSLWYAAWNPEMRRVTDLMREALLAKWPALSFMFIDDLRVNADWVPEIRGSAHLVYRPNVQNVCVRYPKAFTAPRSTDMHPVDMLHFHPKYLENNVGEVTSLIEISRATMGQDQRHRTVKRGTPYYTGAFYMLWSVRQCVANEDALTFYEEWLALRETLPPTLADALAPYGAMVQYEKVASFNALLHECAKRLCWCAQEEIYNVALQVWAQLDKELRLLNFLSPPCFEEGKCGEGVRYCGRSIIHANSKSPSKCFVPRSI